VPRFSELADVNIDQALAWYANDDRIPSAFESCHPLVIAQARRISGGDWRRCVRDTDGGIIVHAEPKWQREASEE
jgi:hypothetical protein